MPENASATATTRPDPEGVPATIRSAWADVLAADTVEPDTHFFDFGGHSVTAMRMMIRLRRELNTRLSTRLIFDHPVLRDFTDATLKQLADAHG